MKALISLASDAGVPDIVLHAFTDGRDTLPDSGAGFVEQAEEWLRGRPGGSAPSPAATSRWTATAAGTGSSSPTTRSCTAAATQPDAASGVEAVRAAYERDETDEFVKATVVGEEARIRDGDAVLFFNFRPDRARELTRALGEDDFSEFDRGDAPSVALTTLTEYHEGWPYPVAFPPSGRR